MTQDAYPPDVNATFQEISDTIINQKCILLAGCGLTGQAYVKKTADSSPEKSAHPPHSWRETLTAIFEWCIEQEIIEDGEFQVDFYHLDDKEKQINAAQTLQGRLNARGKMEQCLQDIFYYYEATPGQAHELIVQCSFRAFLTVGYDMFIEDAYASVKKRRFAHFYEDSIERAKRWFQEKTKKDMPFILKLHGDLDYPEVINLADRTCSRLQQADKITYKKNLKTILSTSSILAVGFEDTDTDLEDLLALVGIDPTNMKYWKLLPGEANQSSMFEAEAHDKDQRINVIRYRFDETHSGLARFFEELLEKPQLALAQEEMKQIKIYLAYDPKDIDMKNRLGTELKNLQKRYPITVWSKDDILGGQPEKDEITRRLNIADMVLLLISSTFLASEDYSALESSQALVNHNEGKTSVVPIIISSTNYEGTSFEHLQFLPKDGRTIKQWPDKEEAFLSIGKDLEAIIRHHPLKVLPRPGSPTPTNGEPKRFHFPYF